MSRNIHASPLRPAGTLAPAETARLAALPPVVVGITRVAAPLPGFPTGALVAFRAVA